MLVVVISQDSELSQPGFQRAEERLDPLDRFVMLDDVAGDDEQVGCSRLGRRRRRLEEVPVEARGEVKVAELDDLQAVERAQAGRAPHVPLAKTELERLVAGQPQEPGVAGRCRSSAALPFASARSIVREDPVMPARRRAKCQVERVSGQTIMPEITQKMAYPRAATARSRTGASDASRGATADETQRAAKSKSRTRSMVGSG